MEDPLPYHHVRQILRWKMESVRAEWNGRFTYHISKSRGDMNQKKASKGVQGINIIYSLNILLFLSRKLTFISPQTIYEIFSFSKDSRVLHSLF